MFCDTGKICFPNKSKASKAAGNLSKGDKHHKYSCYQCPLCNNWHTNTVKKKKSPLPKNDTKYPKKFRGIIIKGGKVNG